MPFPGERGRAHLESAHRVAPTPSLPRMHRTFRHAGATGAALLLLSCRPMREARFPTPGGGETTAAISAADLRARLHAFAHDSMLGRESAQLGNVKATDYLASEMRRLGLEPAGEGGTYFQTVPFVVRELVRAETRLEVDGRALRLLDDWAPVPRVNFSPFGGSRSLDGLETVYGGRLGDSTSLASPAQISGKLVVVTPPLAADGQPSFRFWGARALDRFAGAAAVAVASLEITPPTIVGLFIERQETIEVGAVADTVPAGLLVTLQTAERLLGSPITSARPGQRGRTVRGRTMYASAPVEHPARNVIAILRGRDASVNEQFVAISAHSDHEGVASRAVDPDSLRAFNRVMRPQGANDPIRPPAPGQWARIRTLADSLRAGRPSRRDSIYNGADDDGSGSVTMLEIAEAMVATPRPRRSILFVWHTAEEKGLLGSFWFTDNPTVPRDSIVALLNMDMVGRGRAEDIAGGGPSYLQVIGSRRLSTELGALIDSLSTRRSTPMRLDYAFDAPGHPLNRYCRSDHYSYARYGIPISYFSRGYSIDYHMPTDEPQYIDYDGMARVGSFLRDVLVAVADRPRRLVVDKPMPDPRAPCRQ